MKTTLKLAALAAVMSLAACQQQADTQATSADGSADPVVLDTSEKRLSYGIAHNMGTRLSADGVPVDANAFAAGMRDALAGNEPLMTQEEIIAEMQTFQQAQTERMQAESNAAATRNAEEGEKFLTENAAREGVVSLDSGLQYEILEAGTGATPASTDTVEVHYRGTLINGTEFDSSYKRGQTVNFGVTQVIAGWTEALQLMKVGAKWRLFIPSDLAYGPGGAGQLIGPNATLLFDVELVSIAE